MPTEIIQEDTQFISRGSQHQQRGPAGEPMEHQGPESPFNHHLSRSALRHGAPERGEIPEHRDRVCGDRIGIEGCRERGLDNQPLVAHHGDAGDLRPVSQGEEDGAERLHQAGLRVAGGTGQATIVAAAKSSNDGGLPRFGQRSNLPA